MIIRDYSAPNIRVISEIRGEIHNTNRTNHTKLYTTKFMVNSYPSSE